MPQLKKPTKGFKKRSIEGYRQSKNIEDYRNATFIDQTEYDRLARKKARQPVPQTYKEPLEWQRDDRTDEQNARSNRGRAIGNIDLVKKATRKNTGIKPQKMSKPNKNFPFLEPKKQ